MGAHFLTQLAADPIGHKWIDNQQIRQSLPDALRRQRRARERDDVKPFGYQ